MKFDGGGSERIRKSERAFMLSLLPSNVASLILWGLPLLYFEDMSDILDAEFHRFSIGADAVAVLALWVLCTLPCPLDTGVMVLYMALFFDPPAALVTTVTSRSI
jgi:hypothetical protein